jgi:hypothetical protein
VKNVAISVHMCYVEKVRESNSMAGFCKHGCLIENVLDKGKGFENEA